ncbi:MAG TPA: RNA polymerase sigma factor [Acetivibrio clariflavus]|nr:RNA polymerase sigma factor [Acetivibrio clariflavus]
MDIIQELYEQNYKKVYYYLKNISNNNKIAEDLTQETFYKMLKHINTFKNEDINLAWLVKVAHNLFVDYLRRNKLTLNKLSENESTGGCFTTEVDDKLDISTVLNKLPIRYKSLIILKDYFGFSYDEISEMINSTPSAVKSALRRARNNFKEVYKSYESCK